MPTPEEQIEELQGQLRFALHLAFGLLGTVGPSIGEAGARKLLTESEEFLCRSMDFFW